MTPRFFFVFCIALSVGAALPLGFAGESPALSYPDGVGSGCWLGVPYVVPHVSVEQVRVSKFYSENPCKRWGEN